MDTRRGKEPNRIIKKIKGIFNLKRKKMGKAGISKKKNKREFLIKILEVRQQKKQG